MVIEHGHDKLYRWDCLNENTSIFLFQEKIKKKNEMHIVMWLCVREIFSVEFLLWGFNQY